MGLFSRKAKRSGKPEFATARWRGLVSSVSKTCEMTIEKFNSAVASERASCAAHSAAGDSTRARAAAELALRNRAMVKALGRLASLADALHGRAADLPITSISSLRDLHEPIRTEVVSFVYAAGRLSVQPLSEAVEMLKVFFPDDVDDIIRARSDWPDIMDKSLYQALAPGPANAELVDKELQAAYAEYPEYSGSGSGSAMHHQPPPVMSPSPAAPNPSPLPQQSPHSSSKAYSPRPPSPRPAPANLTHSPPPAIPVFASQPGPAQVPRPWERNAPNAPIPPTPAEVYSAASSSHPPVSPPPAMNRASQPVQMPQPDYMHGFQDSDEAVVQRYRDLLAG